MRRPRHPSVPLACLVALLASTSLVAPAAAFARQEAQKPRAAQRAGNSFLWKATSDTNTVYLLGSIHVARDDFYPLPEEIERAFEESKVLAVEVDVKNADAVAAVQQAMLTKGVHLDGGTLADDVSPDTLKRFREHYRAKNLPGQQLEVLRPWAAALTLAIMELQAIGFKADLGIDVHFLTKAHDASKPVVELESAAAQIDLLSGFGKELEEKFLVQTLAGMDDLGKTMDKAAEAWKSGDVKTLQAELLDKPLREAPETKPVYEKLFDERNVKMAEKVEGFLKGGEQHFVVVGAGHLIGKQGMVDLLKKKGFKVEQVRVTAVEKKAVKR